MALLAEEIVEEWLNRQGYFTIRGIKLGVHEIDLLAVKWRANGTVDARHIEVQASMNPISFISRVPKKAQKTGRAANSVRRSSEELVDGVREWVNKKFQHQKKKELMKRLCNAEWSSELVLNKVHNDDEKRLIRDHGVIIIELGDILRDVSSDPRVVSKVDFPVESASGKDIIDLVKMEPAQSQAEERSR